MKYIKFKLEEEKPKTKVYAVASKSTGDGLGRIKWYGPWRQYCFFPFGDTTWSKGCLNEINDFISTLMDERRK